MTPLSFVFVTRDHQPVGNSDGVFEESFEKAHKLEVNLLDLLSRREEGNHRRLRLGPAQRSPGAGQAGAAGHLPPVWRTVLTLPVTAP